MRFQRETLGEAESEILQLAPLHYREVSQFRDHIALEPNLPRYHQIENLGHLYLFTAREDDELVGYATFITGGHVHYSSSRHAQSDLLFLIPTRRGYAMSFILFCDEQMKADGIDAVTHSVSSKKDFSPVLKRLGYEATETIYTRRLKDG